MEEMNNIVSNCPLCETRALHVIDQGSGSFMSQCMQCGYATADKFKGSEKTCFAYTVLPKDMKTMSKKANGNIWIPAVMTLPMGLI